MNTEIAKKSFSLKTWLFDPFYYIAGIGSFSIGMIAMLAASLIGSLSHSHFDGVVDFHTGFRVPLWFFIAEGLISLIAMSITVYLGGLIVSKTRFRIVDVFGTQALARCPTLVIACAALIPGYEQFAGAIGEQPLNFSAIAKNAPGGFVSFIIVTSIVIAMTIWMIYLMYRAFAVSCNVSGVKAVITFIVAIITGEVLSKILIMNVLTLILRS